MRAITKDFTREIKNTKSRFFSILVLVALAVAFLSGLRATAPDMKLTGHNYFERQKLADIQIISTVGLTDEDLAKLLQRDEIEEAEGVFVMDAFVSNENTDKVAKVYSMPESGINALTVLEGRLPVSDDECIVDEDSRWQFDIKIGDKLHLAPDESFEDTLTRRDYTVVGVGRSPLYVSVSKGTSTIGSGSVAIYMFIPKANFDSDIYTNIFVRLKKTDDMIAFSQEYDDYVSDVISSLEDFGQGRADMRHGSLLGEIDDAQQEFNDKKNEAYDELADAKRQLEDANKELVSGRSEIVDAEKKIRDGEIEIADGEKEIAENEKKIADGEKEISDNEKKLADSEKELASAQKQISDGWSEYNASEALFNEKQAELAEGKKTLDAAYATLDDGEKEYAAGLAEFNAGKKKLDDGRIELDNAAKTLEDARLQLEDAKIQLEDAAKQIEDNAAAAEEGRAALDSMSQLFSEDMDSIYRMIQNGGLPRSVVLIMGIAGFSESDVVAAYEGVREYDRGVALYNEKLALYEQGIKDYEAGLAEYNSNEELWQSSKELLDDSQKLLESSRAELDSGWAEYNKGLKEYNDGKKQLDDGRAQLESAKSVLLSAESELSSGRKQFNDGKKELEKAKETLADGKKELQDGKQKIIDSKAEIDDAKVQLSDAKEKLRTGEEEYLDGLSEYDDAKNDVDEELDKAQREIDKAIDDINKIEEVKWYVLSRSYNPGYSGLGQDADRMANLANVFPMIFFLVAALVCLTTMTRMVEEQRIQIGSLKALGYGYFDISFKYIGYGLLPALLGSAAGLVIGYTLFPTMIFTAYQIMYQLPNIELHQYTDISIMCVIFAVICTAVATLAACLAVLRDKPANLMRPKTPAAGKRVLLERITFIWKKLSFIQKVTARNLLRYKKRFWMTIFGIGGCTALIIAAFGLRYSLTYMLPRQYDELMHYTAQITLNANLDEDRYDKIISYIDSNPHVVEYANPRMSAMTAASDKSSQNAYFCVIDSDVVGDYVDLLNYDTQETIKLEDGGVYIDQKLSELLGVEIGDEIFLDADSKAYAKVLGVFEHYVAHYVYMTPASYVSIFEKPLDNNSLLITLDTNDVDVCDEIFTDLMKLDGVNAASRLTDLLETFLKSMERIDFVVVILIIAAGALALVVLYNLSNINITERKRELATIKVLGFYDKEVSAYVYRENIVLTILGIALGVVLGNLLHTWLVRSVEIDMMMFGRQTNPMSYAFALALTTVFAIIANVLAHFKMKRIDMVESLKSAE